MLEVSLREVSFRYKGGFALHDLTLTFPRSAHTAVAGPPACGASTLLRLVAGLLKPDRGDVLVGQRRVNDVKASRRPLLYVTSDPGVPGRWSVRHALVAAVRGRTLDREDRQREYALAVDKWGLAALLDRRLSTLSSNESARVHLARIELIRPAILLADRLLERVSPAERLLLADELYRTLRVISTTTVSAPSSREELAFTDLVTVLYDGRVVQSGAAAEIYSGATSEWSAAAVGEYDLIPVSVSGDTVDSPIGRWTVSAPPFQGEGVAVVRPSDFTVAKKGEDSDLIFGVEEAGFLQGRWLARGLISGGVSMRVELPIDLDVHKGRLLPLRYDPSRFLLLPRRRAAAERGVPANAVPPMRESR